MRLVSFLLLIMMAVGALAAPPVQLASDRSDSPTWLDEAGSTTTWAILAAGAMGSILALDDERSGGLGRAVDKSSLDDVVDFGNTFGSGYGVGGLAVAAWTWGAVAGRPAAQELGGDLISSFALTAAMTWAIKAPVNRTRPNGGAHSFPSGHTAAAFSTVPPLWRHAGWPTGLGMAALATATGLGRIEENKHFLSDVISGAALGLVCGRIAVAACDCGWWVEPSSRGLTAVHEF